MEDILAGVGAAMLLYLLLVTAHAWLCACAEPRDIDNAL